MDRKNPQVVFRMISQRNWAAAAGLDPAFNNMLMAILRNMPSTLGFKK